MVVKVGIACQAFFLAILRKIRLFHLEIWDNALLGVVIYC